MNQALYAHMNNKRKKKYSSFPSLHMLQIQIWIWKTVESIPTISVAVSILLRLLHTGIKAP
jgi:hypothetical protein